MNSRMFPFVLLAALSVSAVFAQDPNTVFLPSSVAADTARANQFNSSAHLRLGYKYLTGLAGKVDKRKAAEHFAAAARQNVPAASAWLGYTYVTAPELGHAAPEGLALIQQAANAGDPVGQTLLGHLFQTGQGLLRDLVAARALYLAAVRKFALAPTYLGEIYLASGDPTDVAKAFVLFERAAASGETRSMVHLADLLARGSGVRKDTIHSTQWLNRASARNDPMATYRKGLAYYYGVNAHKSPRMAAQLFAKSANTGYSPAQAALGMCYAAGDGVAKDLNEAVRLLELAAPRDQYAARQLALLDAGGGRR